MDVLERIPVPVKDIGGVVSRIVFQSCGGCNIVSGASGHCRLVEFIDLILIFGHKAPVNGCWIRLPLLDPEERPLAITKSPQIGMTVFALVRHEEFDVKWLQRRLIEGQRTFDIADSQNNVVEHSSPSQITSASTAFSPLGTAWIASGGMFIPSARTVWTSSIPMKPRIWRRYGSTKSQPFQGPSLKTPPDASTKTAFLPFASPSTPAPA